MPVTNNEPAYQPMTFDAIKIGLVKRRSNKTRDNQL